ncbi:MAG: hypothetical protein ACI4II_01960 [Acutalibacteraceae bacterium]
MKRDFSEKTRLYAQRLMSEEGGTFSRKTCSSLNNYSDLIYSLNIDNYINNVDGFMQLLDKKNTASKKKINNIFNGVNSADKSYAAKLKKECKILSEYNSYLKKLTETISCGNINRSVQKQLYDSMGMNLKLSILQDSLKGIVRFVGGVPIVNPDLFTRLIVEDISRLSYFEQMSLITAIESIQNTARYYKALERYAEHDPRVRLLSTISDIMGYSIIGDVGRKSTEVYINILERIVSYEKVKNSFAWLLMNASIIAPLTPMMYPMVLSRINHMFYGDTLVNHLSKIKNDNFFVVKDIGETNILSSSIDLFDYERKDKISKSNDLDKKDNDNSKSFIERTNVKLYEKKYGASVSLYENDFDLGGFGKAGVSVCKAEAQAGYHADFDEGKFRVGAEAGASFSVLSADWDKRWFGDDNFNLDTNVTASVGKVSGKAEANIGLTDEKGNIDPNIKVGAELEAIAGEIEGTAKFNVLGNSASVTGSVGYGIGVHAKAGWSDGKLTYDVGVAMGFGASVKFEVDLGGIVSSVTDKAKAVWDYIT